MSAVALPDGTIQITDNGQMFAPMSIQAVEDAYAVVPQANNALAKAEMAQVGQTILGLLAGADPNFSATLMVTSTAVTAVVDPDTYAAAQTLLGVAPDATGALVYGPATILTTSTDPSYS